MHALTHLDHAVGLVDGVEDGGVAGVVRVLQAVLVQGERQVVDVRHLQGDLMISTVSADAVNASVRACANEANQSAHTMRASKRHAKQMQNRCKTDAKDMQKQCILK